MLMYVHMSLMAANVKLCEPKAGLFNQLNPVNLLNQASYFLRLDPIELIQPEC